MKKTDLPFEDLINWDFLRWNSYLSERHKLLYIATPKVACTLLKWWFADLEGYSDVLAQQTDSRESDPDLIIHDSFHKVAPAVTGLSPEALTLPLTSDAYFRFAVVRNPYKRIFSAWQSKLLLREALQAEPYLQFEFFQIPVQNQEDLARAFEGFLMYLAAHEAPKFRDVHWTPQADLLQPDLIPYTSLSKIEDTKVLKLALARHLGPDIPNPLAGQRKNESLIPYIPEFITARAAELIRELYANDFQAFGYDLKLPEGKVKFSSSELGIALQSIAQIRGRNKRISDIQGSLSKQIANLDGQLTAQRQIMLAREEQIQQLNQAVVEHEKRIVALNQSVQSLFSQTTQKEQVIQSLSSRVKERERELTEIKGSKAWQVALFLRRIRLRLVPSNIALTRMFRALGNPLVKLSARRQLEQDRALILSSGLFDADWYLARNRDVAEAKIEPARHYLLAGGFEGRDPSPNFSSAWYLDRHADVKASGINPLVHYLRYGKREGRAIHSLQAEEKRNLVKPGGVPFDPSRDTVLVVSHEASRTGAPILSLNIVQCLQKKYNVVSMLLGGGSIVENFRQDSTFVVGPLSAPHSHDEVISAIENLLKSHTIKFAIVNSIVSNAALPVLSTKFVPTITLLHEFSAYSRPRGVIALAALWSNELIFSAPVIRENAVHDYPALKNHAFHILPQGRCDIPAAESDLASLAREKGRVLNVLRPENSPADTVVVLGLGFVHIRKGVDLFIECAARVIRSAPDRNYRFVWIGNGYDPEKELNYSAYLADQIQRAGLQDHVFFMKETSNIEAAYEEADVLLISSRLDPLPNVGIDAMVRGIPLVCFDRTTGIADILTANGLGAECVVPYLDTAKMAAQVTAFGASKAFSQRVGEQLRQVALKEFNMENYVSRLEQIGMASSEQMTREQQDVLEISASGVARLDFFLPPHLKKMSLEEAIRYYVRTWASGLERRKLFPGFHPGIYQEQCTSDERGGDPLANYLRAGQPAGPWRYDVITPDDTAQPLTPDLRIALHLHVYYPDLLPDMLERLNRNQVRPDLFVSVPEEWVRQNVQAALGENYSGKVVEIQVVPNRGRDIGPFLTTFGAVFLDRYDIVGHLHTKKTANIKEETMAKNWRLFLLDNLLGGSGNMADVILSRLAGDPSVGMVFPDDPHAEPDYAGWGKNRSHARALGSQLGLTDLPENFLFPIGTMFWARVNALRPLFQLGLDWQDYPEEPLPYDGSALHALERLLPFIVEKQGFRSVLTNVPGITR